MVIYRPDSETLVDSMLEAAEFTNIDDMKKHIVEYENRNGVDNITIDDIMIAPSGWPRDPRCGWWDVSIVQVGRYGNYNYLERCERPKIIGRCATTYIPYNKEYWERQKA